MSRNLSQKQKGSNRRAIAKRRLARLHYRIANQRRTVLHSLSHWLTASYDWIVIEDLNVKGMVKNRKLARLIIDAGFGLLRQFITYKDFFAATPWKLLIGSIHPAGCAQVAVNSTR